MNAKVKEIATPVAALGTISLQSNTDVVTARRAGRSVASNIGFSATQQTAVATAIAELCKNALQYARGGEFRLEIAEVDNRIGLRIEVADRGPGIPDLKRALQGGYSTSGGLGIGLSGAQRIMDEFRVESGPEAGTRVVALKWK